MRSADHSWPAGHFLLLVQEQRRAEVSKRPRSVARGCTPAQLAAARHIARIRSAGLDPRANPPRCPAPHAALRASIALVYGEVGSPRTFQAPSMAFSAGHPWPAAYFSLLVQREVGKRKAPRRRALRASCAPGPRAGPGLRGGPSLAHLSGRRDPSRRSPGVARGRVRARSPRLMGPHQAAAIPGRRSHGAPERCAVRHRSGVPGGQDARASMGPRMVRRAADGNVAGHRPGIAAMDRGDRSDGPWMAHRGGPADARVPGGQDARRARRWGVLLFGWRSLD
jgi:hypothetical protein